MIRIIEPKVHYDYRSRINIFLGLLEYYQKITLRNEEKAQSSFVLAEQEDGGIYGGAILYKKSVCEVEKNIENFIFNFALNIEYVWASTLIHCCPASDKRTYDYAFYSSLLDAYNKIGHKEDIKFLYITLNSFEYLRTKNMGSWPYIYELKPHESPDGLFHGILPLGEQKSKFHFNSHEDIIPLTGNIQMAA